MLDQAALAYMLASGEYDRHLRQMRRRYRARRDALVSALERWLPSASVRGISARMHVLVELPADCNEADVIAAAAARGVAVEPVAPMRSARDGSPAFVIGYARLPEHRLAEAARMLADAVDEASRAQARR